MSMDTLFKRQLRRYRLRRQLPAYDIDEAKTSTGWNAKIQVRIGTHCSLEELEYGVLFYNNFRKS
jgi:hypothetical protein